MNGIDSLDNDEALKEFNELALIQADSFYKTFLKGFRGLDTKTFVHLIKSRIHSLDDQFIEALCTKCCVIQSKNIHRIISIYNHRNYVVDKKIIAYKDVITFVKSLFDMEMS